jgi:hypothetical protein
MAIAEVQPIVEMETCHAHMHGLIHDDWLRACHSCLLKLMYALRVNVGS